VRTRAIKGRRVGAKTRSVGTGFGPWFRNRIPHSAFHTMLLLSCTNVSRGYDANPLFEDVSFEIHAGERVGFVGPNGAGKTTLLKILAGLDEPDAGKVQLHAGARLGILQQVADFPSGRTLF